MLFLTVGKIILGSIYDRFASSISVPLMGAVYDITGSYRLAWYGLFLCSIAIAFSLIGSEIMHRKGCRDSVPTHGRVL